MTPNTVLERIKVHDKQFVPYLSQQQIQAATANIAKQINHDYGKLPIHEQPLFIGILNGSYVFAADLMRAINFDADISFMKVQSYVGTQSTQTLTTTIGLNKNINNRTVILIEDIVDTGNTLHRLIQNLAQYQPTTIKIATLLYKPDACQHPNLPLDYIGLSIPNKFVVGYGLDYNGLGRTYPHIYQLASED